MSRLGPGTRRSSFFKKRSAAAERLIVFARRAVFWGGIGALIFWLGSWMALSGAAGIVSGKFHQKILNMTADAGFYVEDILVEGRVHADAQEIKAIADVSQGDPIFGFNPDETKTMLE